MRLSLCRVCPSALPIGHDTEKDGQIGSFYLLSYMIPRRLDSPFSLAVTGESMSCLVVRWIINAVTKKGPRADLVIAGRHESFES